MMKTITVIIPTYNRLEKLKQLLASLSRQSLSSDEFDILVADDGSTDGTTNYLEANKVAYVSRNHQGPAAARNAGARQTITPYLLFIDDDAVADVDWLKAAFIAVESAHGGLFAAEGDVLRRGEDLPLSHSVHHQGPGGCLTCNLLVSRELFDLTGGFNERFQYPFNEDFDFFLRLRASAPVNYLESMKVHHPVYPLPFLGTFMDAASFARRRIQSERLLFELHPQDFAKVKATRSADASVRRFAFRYLLTFGLANPFQLVKHPVRGAQWLLVCLARQMAFLFLYLRGIRA
jgi:glycosyltransferase involved in cell wall biosynthesis